MSAELKMLDHKSVSEQRAAVIAEAETWINTSFEHATMIKGRGIDCVMFLVACFRAGGVLPADFDPRIIDGEYKPYPRQWFLHHDEERYLLGIEKWGRPIEHPEPGDVGLWKFGRCFSHGAILVTPFVDNANLFLRQGEVIHALQRNGKVERDPITMGDLLRRPVKWFDPYP